MADTYYVDKTTGSDSDTGLTEELAWETINKVNISSFNADDSILFKKGEIWREWLTVPSSGSAGSPITIGAYGSGDDPIISGLREVTGWDTGGNWSEAGEWETVFDFTFVADDWTSTNAWDFRGTVDADTASNSGTKIRVTVEADSTGTFVFDGASIGEMTTDDVYDSSPTRITFNTGSNGGTISASSALLSDEMDFVFDKTKRHGVHLYTANSDNMHYSTAQGDGSHYTMDSGDNTMTLDLSGTPGSNNYAVAKLETFVDNPVENLWVMSLATDPRRLVIDGTEYHEAETEGDVDVTHRWFYDSGNTDLYLYATENPATAYSSMYFAENVDSILMDGKSYITIQDLELQGGSYGLVIYNVSSNILIHDCTIGQYTVVHGIRIQGLTTNPYTQITDVEVYDNIIDGDYHNAADDYANSVGQDGLVILNSVASCKFYNNTIRDWTHACIYVEASIANCTTQYNEFYGNILEAPNTNYCRGIGITDSGTHPQASYNEFYGNLIRNTTVRNQIQGTYNEFYYNIIHTVTQGLGPDGDPDGIGIFGTGDNENNNKFYNNTIYNVTGHGINLFGVSGQEDVHDNLIRNNLIMNWGAGKYGIYIGDVPETLDNTYENNLLYKSGVTDVVYYGHDTVDDYPHTIEEFNAENGTAGDVIGSNISSDPLFTNPGSDDFTLQFNSPCIDAGTDVSLTEDYDGKVVPQGAAPEIGAYEFIPLSGGIPCGDIWAPAWATFWISYPLMFSQIVDAETEKYACIIPAPKTGTISKVHVVAKTVTTAPAANYDIRIETITSGEPSGTLWDTNTNGALTIGASDARKWLSTTLTAGASVTRGSDKIAIVLVPPASPDNGNVAWQGFYSNSKGLPFAAFYNGATWLRSSTLCPLVLLEYSDTTIPKIPNVMPWSDVTEKTGLYSDSALPHHASSFKLNVDAEIVGFWCAADIDADDLTVTLYEGNSTVKRTAILNRQFTGYTPGGAASYSGLFAPGFLASANTLYRISLKNNSAIVSGTDFKISYLSIAPSSLTTKVWNHVPYAGFFSEFYRSESANLSSWTDYGDDLLTICPIIRNIR